MMLSVEDKMLVVIAAKDDAVNELHVVDIGRRALQRVCAHLISHQMCNNE